jgi:hypothetical protein
VLEEKKIICLEDVINFMGRLRLRKSHGQVPALFINPVASLKINSHIHIVIKFVWNYDCMGIRLLQ